MCRLIVSLVAVTLLISPAFAQSRGKVSKAPDSSQQTEDKKKAKAAAEKAYKDALHSIPEQKPTDPWAKMR